jgi:hypothetical protein
MHDLANAAQLLTPETRQSPAPANHGLKFQKRGQLFVGTHKLTLSIAVCVSNPDCSPVAVDG